MEPEVLESERWESHARELKSDGWSFIDLTAVDRLHLAAGTEPVDRFEIVMQLLHLEKKDRLMVRAGIAGDPPTIASITKVWPAANAFEREVYDLFGVRFEGHPDLTRIMLPDEWEGHPLRKDYGVGKVTVQYLPQPVLQVTGDQGTSTVDSHEPVDRLGQAGPPKRGAK